jgi:hypothetical protein
MGEAKRRLDVGSKASGPTPDLNGAVSGIGKFLDKLNAKPAHEPIIKSLEKIGIVPQLVTPDEGSPYFIIPVNELIGKEYQYLTGLNIEAMYTGPVDIDPEPQEASDE